MEHTHEQIDMAANNIVSQVDLYRANSHRLQLEAFKLDSILEMFNNCSDRCQLQYRESGLKQKGDGYEDVECFKNCVTKTHSLSQNLFK